MEQFKDKVVVITGAARGIGKCIADEFAIRGAHVAIIDILPNDYFIGDLSDKVVLERFAEKVLSDYGHVDILVNNAMPLFKGIENVLMRSFVMLSVLVLLLRFIW